MTTSPPMRSRRRSASDRHRSARAATCSGRSSPNAASSRRRHACAWRAFRPAPSSSRTRFDRAGLHDRERDCARRRARCDASDARRCDAAAATGAKLQTATIKLTRAEGDVADLFATHQIKFPDVAMGSYPSFTEGRISTQLVLRSTDSQRLAARAESLERKLRTHGLSNAFAAMRRSGGITHRPALLSPLPAVRSARHAGGGCAELSVLRGRSHPTDVIKNQAGVE